MTESPELATAGHVFISYVKEDRAEVEELSELLAAAGISVWTDKDNLGPGGAIVKTCGSACHATCCLPPDSGG